MTKKRLWQTIRLWSMMSSKSRVDYLKKKKIYGHIGENVTIMDRKVPLYANLIRIHDNVRIASKVTFVTHDITHLMLNSKPDNEKVYNEIVGCIEIMDNVFVGTNVTILNNVRIGPNVIVAAGAVVTKDVPPNSVVGGVPARVICSLDEYVLQSEKRRIPRSLSLVGKRFQTSLLDICGMRLNVTEKNNCEIECYGGLMEHG